MIIFHTAIGILALLSGLGIFVLEKGTPWHKATGRVYVGSMTLLCLTSFWLYELFGGFGPFHIMAILSFLTILAGFIPMFFKQHIPNWLALHYHFMLYSYAGLVMATNSHFMGPLFRLLKPVGLPGSVNFILIAFLCWVVPYLIADYLIRKRFSYLFQDRLRADK